MAPLLLAIKYTRGSLQLLDQRLLPFEFTYLDVPDPKAAWTHIKDMVVRGAPAIGVTGALALAVDLTNNKHAGADFKDVGEAVAYIDQTLDYLVTSRPTAVNLADAAGKLKAVAERFKDKEAATPAEVVKAVVEAAEVMLEEDIAANKAMGKYGAQALLDAAAKAGKGLSGKLRVLTHCNTGSLATAGFGTALGIIRALHEQGKLEHAFCTETRPYNQGARLTAFELNYEGIPSTLICDSAAASLMGSGQVDAVVVGADRVAANGDTANKIGTYSLSIAAKHHGVPFFIAAPTTTLDPMMPNGASIEIEQRPADEITHFRGQRCVKEGIQVWNPSFDVAPATLITGIVTEKGLIPKVDDAFEVRSFMYKHDMLVLDAATEAEAAGKAAASPHFHRLYNETVSHYILNHPVLQQKLGPADSADKWTVEEVGDGNINFVYIITGPQGQLCLKQSLPFVRCVGDSWPLTQDRARIEVLGLMEAFRHAPKHTPEVYHFDSRNAIIVMQYLAPPFIILRKGLVQNKVYPFVADHVAEYMAQTLFNTSCFRLSTEEYRANVSRFTNPEMCKLTEKVIFAEPYTVASNNNYLPALEPAVQALQNDPQAKVAISLLKERFIHSAEALIHGDLHTGSIMVTDTQTYAIDPEFGFYGPMAFDIAKIIGELLLTLFATYGMEQTDGLGPRDEQRAWLIDCIPSIWRLFVSKFSALWKASGFDGDLYPELVLGPSAPAGTHSLSECQEAFFSRLFVSTLGFAGAFMIRRIVGIAGVAELRGLSDEVVRAACEARALAFGQVLLKQVLTQTLFDIETVVSQAAQAAKARQDNLVFAENI